MTLENATQKLNSILGLTTPERVESLLSHGTTIVKSPELEALTQPLKTAIVAVITSGEGAAQTRLALGELLSVLGDPRLCAPSHEDYFANVETPNGTLQIGCYLVTNVEFRAFAESEAYDDQKNWTPEGWTWRQRTQSTWLEKANNNDAGPFILPNQPVVGVNWYEAHAYAKHHKARLPTFDERLDVTRGDNKRPYPWGSPFGKGNANTREEVLGRPCAVGLYPSDCTPEGVYDLAGNVAEWCNDGLDGDQWIHPGSWADSFESSWAKARILEHPKFNSATWGFRLAR